jgi:choline-sulfatase
VSPSLRQRARRASLGALLPALLLLGSCGGADSPGIILVTIDTCRADRIGCYGARNVETRALDALAASGAVFLDAAAAVPLTLPSHCTILTGLYPDRHAVRDNGAARLPQEARTLAEILSDEGWETGAYVAAFPLDSSFGSDQGFTVYDDEFTTNASGSEVFAPASRERFADRLFFDERLADDVVDALLPWLRRALSGRKPFFLWIHFFDPHAVYRPPAHLAARYGVNSYEGEVCFVDEQIGRLLTELGDARERITFVVTADHGEALGEHEERTHGLFIYQSTLHVPWIMSGPGVPVGVRVEDPVSLVQVLPTVLDVAGVETPAGLDGSSALPLLTGGAGKAPEVIYAESLFPQLHFDWAGLRAVRRGRWKLIEAPRPELYDLTEDPHETRNVALEHPEIVTELREELRRHGERGGVLGEEALEVDEETRARLEGLGYVGAGTGAGAAGEADLWDLTCPDPKDRVDFFNRLQEVPTLLVAGKLDEAEKALEELLAEDPTSLSVLQKMVLLRRTQEDWEGVREFCSEILRGHPDDRQARIGLAFSLNRLGKWEAAREEYEALVAQDSLDADAWGLLGSLLSENGRFEEARTALSRGVELAPGDAGLRSSLGRVYEDAGDTTSALAEYGRALSLDPGCSEALNQKALLLSHSGRVGEAVKLLRAGLEHLPEDVETLNNLAWLLVDEDLDAEEAYELSGRALSLSADDAAVLDTRGWSAVRAGRSGEGLAALRRALELTGDAEVRAHLGVALCESGRAEEGRAELRAAVRERAALKEIPEVARWLQP